MHYFTVGLVWSRSTDLSHQKTQCIQTTIKNYQAETQPIVTATDYMFVAQLVKELAKHMSGPVFDFVSSQLRWSKQSNYGSRWTVQDQSAKIKPPCQSLPFISENIP